MVTRRGSTSTLPAKGPARPAILGMHVDDVESTQALDIISGWTAEVAGGRGSARTVCAANVHMVMTAHDDGGFRACVNAADLVIPDGQPLVWALRLGGLPQRRRVRLTPDLIDQLLAVAEQNGWPVLLGQAEDDYPLPGWELIAPTLAQLRSASGL